MDVCISYIDKPPSQPAECLMSAIHLTNKMPRCEESGYTAAAVPRRLGNKLLCSLWWRKTQEENFALVRKECCIVVNGFLTPPDAGRTGLASHTTHLLQICVEEAAGEGGGGGGGNFIVIVPGANYLLSPEDVAAATGRLKGAKVIMVRKQATIVNNYNSSTAVDGAVEMMNIPSV